jgi:predicted metalloprotease with PDZ domain
LPDVGCSFWVQSRGEYSTTTNQGHEFSAGDRTEEITIVEEDETFDDPEWGQPVGEEQEDVMITQVTPEQPSTVRSCGLVDQSSLISLAGEL